MSVKKYKLTFQGQSNGNLTIGLNKKQVDISNTDIISELVVTCTNLLKIQIIINDTFIFYNSLNDLDDFLQHNMVKDKKTNKFYYNFFINLPFILDLYIYNEYLEPVEPVDVIKKNLEKKLKELGLLYDDLFIELAVEDGYYLNTTIYIASTKNAKKFLEEIQKVAIEPFLNTYSSRDYSKLFPYNEFTIVEDDAEDARYMTDTDFLEQYGFR